MDDLREYLQRQVDARGWTLMKAEEETGVAKSTIGNILNGKGTVTLDTLNKLGAYFGLPLWRMLEMTGYTSGVPMDASALALRLQSMREKAPELDEVLDRLAQYDRRDVQAVLAYLESMEQLRRKAS